MGFGEKASVGDGRGLAFQVRLRGSGKAGRGQPHSKAAPSVPWKADPLPAGRWPDNTGLCPLGSCVHGLAASGEAAVRRERGVVKRGGP